MSIFKGFMQAMADLQEKERERQKTRKQKNREKQEFNYIFNEGPVPQHLKNEIK